MKKLIVVDVQPEYKKNIHFDLFNFVRMIKKYDKILYLFVGDHDQLSKDNQETIEDFLLDHNLPPAKLDYITFIDKGYTFLRGWMDYGVPDEVIIKTLQYMINNVISDSREGSWVEILRICDEEWGEGCEPPKDDPIFTPYQLLDIEQLKEFDGADICGGGFNECLKEVDIYLKAIGVQTNYLDEFIYW